MKPMCRLGSPAASSIFMGEGEAGSAEGSAAGDFPGRTRRAMLRIVTRRGRSLEDYGKRSGEDWVVNMRFHLTYETVY